MDFKDVYFDNLDGDSNHGSEVLILWKEIEYAFNFSNKEEANLWIAMLRYVT